MPFETGTQIMTKIKADLTEAANLLKDSEPLLFPDAYDADMIASRPFRMNYFAVKAILARAYLYEGDKSNALREAVEVINAGEQYFPACTDKNDRLFSSEVLFGLYDMERASHIHNALFSCDSTHRQNFSFGTTMRLPTCRAGKLVSCMSS